MDQDSAPARLEKDRLDADGRRCCFHSRQHSHPILSMCRTRASSFFQNKANEIYDQFNAIILWSFSVRWRHKGALSFLVVFPMKPSRPTVLGSSGVIASFVKWPLAARSASPPSEGLERQSISHVLAEIFLHRHQGQRFKQPAMSGVKAESGLFGVTA